VLKAFGPILKKAGALFKTVWNGIRTAVTAAVTAVLNIVKSRFESVKKTVTVVLGAVRKVVGAAWNGIMAVIRPVINWIRSAIPGAFNAVRSRMSSAWNSLHSIASNAFNKVRNAVRSPVNGVIDLINSMIRRLNGIRVHIPGWVPRVGGRSFGVSLPTIPRLAEGGVVRPRSGGVPAVLAEAGEAEAVLPLSKLDRLLSYTARNGRAQAFGAGPGAVSGFQLENYYEAPTADLQDTARALLVLAKARG
jgi:hypothetical protein